MNADKASEELKVIRQLMERPIRYSTMSGVSAILAGCTALAGLAADWHFWIRYGPKTAVRINILVWAGVFAVALAAVVVLTRLRERTRGMPAWSRVKTRILLTIGAPFIAAVGLTFAVVYQWYGGPFVAQASLVPAIWMLFYGVALWQLGEYSPVEVRILGAAFILAGLIVGAFLQWQPYLALGATFGGFHLIYGAIVCVRYGG